MPVAGADLLLGFSRAVTAADGSFEFEDVGSGSHIISAQDPSGNFASTQAEVSSGRGTVNITLPVSAGFTMVGAEPALNDAAVPVGSTIRLIFSEPLAAQSITVSDFRISPTIGPFSLAIAGPEVRIVPSRQLPAGQLVLVELNGEITSTAGSTFDGPLRHAFTTSTSDGSAPRLVQVQPAAGATQVPVNLSLRFQFNEVLAKEPTPVVLVTPSLDTRVEVVGNTVLVIPEPTWPVNADIEVALSGVSDLHGNTTAAVATASFRSGTGLAAQHNQQPEWNRVLDRVFFTSDRLGSFDVYSIALDGSELLQLTSGPLDELSPTVSSDGTLLAYQSTGPDGDYDIFAMSTDGLGEPQQLTAAPFDDTAPAFSRTFSRQIFFTSNRTEVDGLFSMEPDGSAVSEIDRDFGSAVLTPAPHPLLDTQLLFVSPRDGSLDIWRKSISVVDNTAVNLNLTPGQLISAETAPSWSPDASFIAFVSDQGGRGDLWLLDLGSVAARQITTLDSGDLADPYVSPLVDDPRCAATLRRPDGSSDIVIIDLVGGTIEMNLTSEGSPDQ